MNARWICGLVAAAALLSGCGTSETVAQVDKATGAQMVGVLQSAGQAEDEAMGTNGAYTTDVNVLTAEGLRLPPGVELSIPSVTADSFCIEATQGTATWHLDRTQGVPTIGSC